MAVFLWLALPIKGKARQEATGQTAGKEPVVEKWPTIAQKRECPGSDEIHGHAVISIIQAVLSRR